jgi:pyruvate,water dikinase
MKWIVAPENRNATDEMLTGGKGASLARLVALGVRVPPFVVISTRAWQAMAATGPDPSLIDEIREALAGLDDRFGLAVRSSAVGEDAADASFAGLYHTSLEVRGLEAVVDAVRTCWRSYHDAHAAAYREERADDRTGGMGVVIQQMIIGDWSGVSFTANPVTQALSEAVVNAVPGLGEALVSGEVNPEEIALETASGAVRRRSGGDAEHPRPDAALTEIFATSMAIAGQLGFPQDIEWAWRGDTLYILQSRPITTIADVYYSRAIEPWRDDPAADPDRPGRLWSRMLADETWVSPISPLFYNIHNSTPGRVAFIRSHGDTAPLPPDLFKYHRATAYVDIGLIERMYAFQPRRARIQAVLNFLPRERQAGLAAAKWRWAGRLRRMLSYEFKDRQWRSFFRNYAWVNAQWPPYETVSDAWLDLDLDTLPLDQLRAHQAEQQGWMAKVGAPCAIAVLSHASDIHLLLTGLLDRWCRKLGSDGENLYARISAGLDDSETVREAQQLWTIARDARAAGLPLESERWSEFRSAATGSAEGRRLVSAFEEFWRRHRHLGANYKDVVWPRWGDDIDACYAVMRGYASSASPEPVEVNARSAAARRNAQREILASVPPVRRAVLRWLFRYNERYMSVRDNHRHYVDRNWYEVRRIYRSYGKRLAEAGVLADRDEIFFLGTGEIEDALAGRLGPAEAERRIEVRRRVWQATLHRQGPKFLKGWSPYSDTSPQGAVGEVAGIAASPGTVIGVARIVYDVSGLSAVRDGEILVTRQTDPSWTSVFGRIGGLVLETGGVLSHGTSLCREYGLPCVTAVEQATVRIPDGAMVELIGDAGLVRLVEASPTGQKVEELA